MLLARTEFKAKLRASIFGYYKRKPLTQCIETTGTFGQSKEQKFSVSEFIWLGSCKEEDETPSAYSRHQAVLYVCTEHENVLTGKLYVMPLNYHKPLRKK